MVRSAQETRSLRKRRTRLAFLLVGLCGFLIFLARALFGETGILIGYQVKAEYERVLSQTRDLRLQNEELKRQIVALKTNPRAMEALGRKEFGFSHPAEIVFVFPGETKEP